MGQSKRPTMTTTKNWTLSVPTTMNYESQVPPNGCVGWVRREGWIFTIPNGSHNVPHVFPKVVPNSTISFAQSSTILTYKRWGQSIQYSILRASKVCNFFGWWVNQRGPDAQKKSELWVFPQFIDMNHASPTPPQFQWTCYCLFYLCIFIGHGMGPLQPINNHENLMTIITGSYGTPIIWPCPHGRWKRLCSGGPLVSGRIK